MPSRPVPAFDSPLARPPLDGALILNGGFGEYRPGHFHAGVDLGTGHRVGMEVLAPLPGWVERVRTSGVGYGRSLYLHAADGRLLVFGHLDAFAGPLGEWVAAAQESTAQYEQDLWPAAGRFRVAAGERIAWSGESGAGGPHLHFEIRRGDMAYQPVRAGLAVADTAEPRLDALTLEPLDDESFVERSAYPVTVRLGARPETLEVIGRVRVSVRAHEARPGVRGMVPWHVAVEFAGQRLACEFDSVSWATDMVESDEVFDAGRITGDRGIVMWAPAGFRPRVLRASVPDDQEAGTFTVSAEDPPRTLLLEARGTNGRDTRAGVVLRPPPAARIGPDSTARDGAPRRHGAPEEPRVEFGGLPHDYLRLDLTGAPPASHGVALHSEGPGRLRLATPHEGRWCVVIPESLLYRQPLVFRGVGPGGIPWTHEVPKLAWDSHARATWQAPDDAFFERRGPLFLDDPARLPKAGNELEFEQPGFALGLVPVTAPMRRPGRLAGKLDARVGRNVALYRSDGGPWEYLGRPSERDGFLGESRQLGYFAFMADTLAPRIRLLRPARRAAVAGPYSRWSLRTRVVEVGSGVDSRASHFEVDGKAVPTEWDAEEGVLRWRPFHPPARGLHRFVVVATDRSGNVRRAAGRFAID